ncbi:MAG: hypothetical protein V1799_22030 [bacterium]
MGIVVSLKDVVEALERSSQTFEYILDTETGEVILITEDDRITLEGSDTDFVPEWQIEHIQYSSSFSPGTNNPRY